MSTRIEPLHPWPLERLLARIAQEWAQEKSIFSLAGRRFWQADPDVDLSAVIGGRRVATPVGPAAGPHTQMAQNLALGWLAGARVLGHLGLAAGTRGLRPQRYPRFWLTIRVTRASTSYGARPRPSVVRRPDA